MWILFSKLFLYFSILLGLLHILANFKNIKNDIGNPRSLSNRIHRKFHKGEPYNIVALTYKPRIKIAISFALVLATFSIICATAQTYQNGKEFNRIGRHLIRNTIRQNNNISELKKGITEIISHNSSITKSVVSTETFYVKDHTSHLVKMAPKAITAAKSFSEEITSSTIVSDSFT